MVLHVLFLYVPAAIALVATATTLRRRDDPDVLFDDVVRLWPFPALALIEALQPRAAGYMIHQWYVPGAAAAIALFSLSPVVIRRTRQAMILIAFVLWVHGMILFDQGYVTRPVANFRGRSVEPDWYTPLTRFQWLTARSSGRVLPGPSRRPGGMWASTGPLGSGLGAEGRVRGRDFIRDCVPGRSPVPLANPG